MKISQLSTFTLCVIVLSMFVITPVYSLPAKNTETDMQTTSIGLNQVSAPAARVSNINPISPTPSQDLNIFADVISPAGVDESKVDFIYTLRGVENSTTVEPMSQVSPVETIPSNPIFTKVDISSNRMEVEYSYVSDYINFAEIILRSTNVDFIYYEITYYNLKSGQWVLYETAGNTDGSVSLGKLITLDRTGVMGGFGFSAILKGSQQPEQPTFDSIRFQSARQYFVNVPPIGQSVAVDYYIRAEDFDGTVFYSQNNTLFVNNKPTVTSFHDLPIDAGNIDTIALNATIEDLDGINTLQKAIAYYKPESRFDWQSTKLTNLEIINSTSAIYGGILNLTIFGNFDENLEVYIETIDIVGGIVQVPTTSSTQLIAIDNQGPVLLGNIQLSATPLSNNATRVNETISISLTLTDRHGVASAKIGIVVNNNAENRTNLLNATLLQEADTTEDFSFSFQPYAESTTINYRLVTVDFLGNSYVSPYYQVYVDEDGPLISEISSGPEYPTNSSGAAIVYNIDDKAGIDTQSAFYTIDGLSWIEATPETINYQDELIDMEIYSLDSLPGNIRDNGTTSFHLDVDPSIDVDQAILKLDIIHQRISDLKYYLQLDDNTSIPIQGRSENSQLAIDLSEFIDVSQLQTYNLTLIVEDVVYDLIGTVNEISIEMNDYSVPLGFDYKFYIPPQENDTIAKYYFHLIDNFGYETITGNYSIYLDAIPPVMINYTALPSNLDAEGSTSVQLNASYTDKGGMGSSLIYYRFNSSQEWKISAMVKFDSSTSSMIHFVGYVPLMASSGELEYFIRGYDNAGWDVNSSSRLSSYINANAPVITLVTNITSPIDLNEENFLTLQVKVTDNNDIEQVKIHYSLNGDDYQITNMAGIGNDIYEVKIEVNSRDGAINFYVTALDGDGLTGESEMYTATYVNSGVSDLIQYLPYAAAVAGGIVLIGVANYLLRRKNDQILPVESEPKPKAKNAKKKETLRANSILFKKPK